MFGLPALFSFLAGKGTLAAAMPGIASVGLGLSAAGGAQGRGRSEGEFDPKRMESAPDYVPRKFNIFVDPYTGAYYNSPEDRDKAIAESRQRMGVMAAAQGGYIQGYNVGGFIEGPGTGTSDSIPASIFQNGVPVQEARLSDGEFVMTKKAVDNSGGAPAMYARMKQFENGGPA
jgi:hypothetical protein